MSTLPASARLVALSDAVSIAPGDLALGARSIGRAESCDVVVARPLVSRLHARVVPDLSCFLLIDAGSANGTFLNGRRIDGPQQLRAGDQIGVADPAPLLRFDDPDGTRARADALRFDLDQQRFFLQDRPLSLTQQELKLLLFLRSQAGRVCSREDCIHAVWHTRTAVDAYRGALDQMVYQLRSKLTLVDPRADLVKTVRGEGYLLEGC